MNMWVAAPARDICYAMRSAGGGGQWSGSQCIHDIIYIIYLFPFGINNVRYERPAFKYINKLSFYNYKGVRHERATGGSGWLTPSAAELWVLPTTE